MAIKDWPIQVDQIARIVCNSTQLYLLNDYSCGYTIDFNQHSMKSYS